MKDVKDVDSALAKVGGYKRWNLAMYFLLAVSFHIPLCWHGLSIVFVGELPSVLEFNLHVNVTNLLFYAEQLNWTCNYFYVR